MFEGDFDSREWDEKQFVAQSTKVKGSLKEDNERE